MAPNDERYSSTETYAGQQATRVNQTQQRMPDEDRTSRVDLQRSITDDQAARLDDGVRMGEDRAIGDTPNWEAYDSQQLYDFATQQNNPSTADTLGQAFTDGGNRLAEAANGLLDAVTKLESAWSGEAADSARVALAPLAKAAGNAGQTAQMMGVQMSRQSVAAQEVSKLPPPKTFDKSAALEQMAAAGLSEMTPDMKAAQDAADETKRQQISYLNTYTQTMSSVDAETPSFIPPEPGSIDSGGGGGVSSTGGNVGPLPGGGPDSSTSAGPGGGLVGVDPSGAHQGIDGPGDDSENPIGGFGLPGGNTGVQGYTPSTGPSSLTSPGLPGGGASTMHPSGPSAGAGGFGGAFGNFGTPGGGAGGAGGGSGQGAGPRGAGGAPGGTPVPGSTARGPAGRGGVGAPGGRGRKEEDEEHDRPEFLIEGDPEGTFGSDAMTAPPVIGGDDE
jgi:hypothetical protein